MSPSHTSIYNALTRAEVQLSFLSVSVDRLAALLTPAPKPTHKEHGLTHERRNWSLSQ